MSEQIKNSPAKVAPLPPSISYAGIVRELTAAHSAVGELRGFLDAIPNPNLLIAPFRKREAVASSAIEGTQATLEEVLKYEALDGVEPGLKKNERDRKIQDIDEIINYEKAMSIALKELKAKPIGENLLKTTHSVLLNSVRGDDKDRGNFRRVPVRVGDYIPPIHTEITGLISNWEKYLNTDIEKDVLVRIGVAHYQFEAIHPFLDGNGRIGRLIIPLFLCQEGVLQTPVLFISHFLEEHKVEYRRLLHEVDIHNDWEPWLKFFLLAVEVQAKKTTEMAKQIQKLYEELKLLTVDKIRSQHAIMLLDYVFRDPILTAGSVRKNLKARSKGTTYNLIEKFIEIGILKEYRGIGRENFYVFSALMNILRV